MPKTVVVLVGCCFVALGRWLFRNPQRLAPAWSFGNTSTMSSYAKFIGTALVFVGSASAIVQLSIWAALPGAAVIAWLVLSGRAPTANETADRAERLLNGTTGTWDVDDYEHLNPHDPRLRDLWRRTMEVGGLPEEWPRLDEAQKNQLRKLIGEIREIAAPPS